MIDALSASIFWLSLWALREVERHRRFKKLAEENAALRAVNEERVRQVERLEAQGQKHLRMLAIARDTTGAIAKQLAGDVNGLPPASAELNGAALVRVTTQLTANSVGLS